MSGGKGIEIYLPCRELRVRGTLTPPGGPTRLEQLVLRAVAAGLTDIHALSDVFAIGHRPMLDLIADLWRRGQVLMDLRSARLDLPSDVRAKVEGGDAKSLQGGLREEKAWVLMQDLLCGQILALKGRKSAPPAGYTVPSSDRAIEVTPVQQGQLLRLLQSLTDEELPAEGPQARRVDEAFLDDSEIEQSNPRWLALVIDCTVDPDTKCLAVEVVLAEGMPSEGCREIEKALARLAAEKPDDYFVRQMMEKAMEAEPPRPTPENAILALEAQLADLASVDPGLVPRRHGDLVRAANAASGALLEREVRQVELRTLAGGPAHLDAVIELIGRARKQIVLACPFVRYDAFNHYYEQIKARLERGTRLYLFWGIAPEGELDTEVRRITADLREEYPGLVFVSRRSARSHVKLVICDDREAIVTSYNFLDPSKDDTLELGVHLRPPNSGSGRQLVRDLLDWARRTYPDLEVAGGMLQSEYDFQRVDEAASRVARWPDVPGAVTSLEVGVREPLVRLWASEWRTAFQHLRWRLDRLSLWAATVENQTHHQRMWDAARSAGRRLVIASDKLSQEVVHPAFLRKLRERLAEGVSIALVFRSSPRKTLPGVPSPVEALRSLEDQFPKLFALRQHDTHAKLLVHDDTVLVTSFNFLSFEGRYGEGGGALLRERAELGIEVRDQVVADRILAELVQRVGALPGAISPPSQPRKGSLEPEPTRRPSLVPFLQAASAETGDLAGVLSDWVAKSVDPWADLEALAEASPSAALHRRAVAAALDNHGSAGGSAAVRWRRWLAQAYWHRDDRVRTALLLIDDRGPFPEGLPGPWLARLAALPAGSLARCVALDDAPGEALRAGEVQGLAALLLVELLLHGRPEASRVLGERRDALKGPLKAWARGALDYWDATHRPLPSGLLAARRARARQLRDREKARESLVEDLDRVFQPFHLANNPVATMAATLLQRKGEVMDRLRELVEKKDAIHARDWQADPRQGKEGPIGLFNEVVDRAAPGGVIVGRHRDAFVNRLTPVFETLERWLALVEAPLTQEGDAWEMEEAIHLLDQIEPHWDALAAEAKEVGRLEAPLFGALLREMTRFRAREGSA